MRTFPLAVQRNDRILIIAPHPDDESIGVGGLIALYPKQCDVVVMTDGRYGNSKIPPHEMKKIRKEEFCKSMEKAGVESFMFCGIEDGTLIRYKDCFSQIDFSKYSLVFLPNPNDNHSDHTASCRYAIQEIKKQQLGNIKVFQYEVHNPMPDVTSHLDISDVIEKKQELIACHASQMETHPYVQQVKILAKYRGYQNEQPDRYLEAYTEVKLEDKNEVSTGTEIELSKYKQFTKLLSKWVSINSSSNGVSEYLLKKGYSIIAIYGYGQIGKLLYQELQNSNCKVEYIIDRNENVKEKGICIYHEIENLKKVDIVIVTAMAYYEEISRELWEKSRLLSISLEDVIMNFEGRIL